MVVLCKSGPRTFTVATDVIVEEFMHVELYHSMSGEDDRQWERLLKKENLH